MKDYANLSKNGNKDENKKKFIFSLVKFLLSCIAVAGLFMAIVLGYNEISRRYAQLRYIIIAGNHILPTSIIKQYISDSGGSDRLSTYAPSKIYFKIISNPWIKNVKIAKIFPDTLYVVILEKKPLAYVYYRKKIYLIDKRGSLIGEYKKYLNLPRNLPKIVLKINLLKNKQLLKSVVNIYEKLDKIEKINYIDVVSESYQVVYFAGGLKVVVSSFDCPDVAIKRLKEKWKYLNAVKNKLDSVSICFDNKFVLKWKKGVER